MTMLPNSFAAAVRQSVLLCGISIAAVACGADIGDDRYPDLERDGLVESDLAKLVQVSANGTGCPTGGWKATLDPSKQSFTVALTGYSAQVSPSSALAVKDCQLAIKLDGKLSYAVEALGYDAAATLGAGVDASVSAEAYFQGDPSRSVIASKQQVGPFTGTLALREAIPAAKQVWSTCGVARDINVRTRIRLQNGTPRGSGTLQVSTLSGAQAGAAQAGAIRFAVRSCDSTSGTGPQVTSTDRGEVTSGANTSTGPTITSVDRTDSSSGSTTGAATPTPTALATASDLAISSVSANGSGCPAGSWSVVPTAPNTLDLRLSSDVAAVTPSKTIEVKDCQLAVKVTSAAGLSYSVKSVSFTGRASLRAQAQAELTANYYFQGDPSRSSRGSRSFSAPASGDYTFQHEVAAADAVWSPCGVERELNLSTRVRLLNGTSNDSSSFELTRVSGLQLAVRPCSEGAGAANALPSGAPSIGSVTRN